MPAFRISLPRLAMSDFTRAAICSGELPTVSIPTLKNFSFTSAVLSTRTISWFNLLIRLGGVLGGANTANGAVDSYPGTDAATVGNPGNSSDGSAVVIANARNRPDLT